MKPYNAASHLQLCFCSCHVMRAAMLSLVPRRKELARPHHGPWLGVRSPGAQSQICSPFLMQPACLGHSFWSWAAARRLRGPRKNPSLLSLQIHIRLKAPPSKAHHFQLGLYTCLYFIGREGIQRKNSVVHFLFKKQQTYFKDSLLR